MRLNIARPDYVTPDEEDGLAAHAGMHKHLKTRRIGGRRYADMIDQTRHDGDETLSGDGRGDHSISSTILKILKSKSGFVLNRWRASGSQLSEKEPTFPVLSLGGNLTKK